jgi:hypothetical protein
MLTRVGPKCHTENMTDHQQTDHAWENRHQILASLDPNATTPPNELDTPTPGADDTPGAATIQGLHE